MAAPFEREGDHREQARARREGLGWTERRTMCRDFGVGTLVALSKAVGLRPPARNPAAGTLLQRLGYHLVLRIVTHLPLFSSKS